MRTARAMSQAHGSLGAFSGRRADAVQFTPSSASAAARQAGAFQMKCTATNHGISDALWIIAALLLLSEASKAQQNLFAVYRESCAVCHGENLEGSAQGTPLVGIELRHGDSIVELSKSVADGFPQTGMPAWSATLDAGQLQRLAIFIAEQRSQLAYADFKVAAPPVVPAGIIESEQQRFRVETVIAGLDPLPTRSHRCRTGGS